MLTFRDNALWLKDGAQNIGHAMATDMVMESTWGRAINDKVCYIYDYWHDDSPGLNSGIEYTPYTEKTKIDARFIVVQQGSLSKDQVEYHIMFKPSVELNLQNDWPVSYYTESFGRFAEFPVGMYIDIPDNRGVYKRWMVCAVYHELRYTKYSVLPCDYRFQWIKDDKLYQMWGVSRLRNQLRCREAFTARCTWKRCSVSRLICWKALRASAPKRKDEMPMRNGLKSLRIG